MQGGREVAPIFAFGFERSGTTLLSMMLGAHPELALPLTVTGMWYAYARRLEQYNELSTEGDLQQLMQDILSEERIRLWDESIGEDEVLAAMEGSDYAALVRAFHRVYANKKGKRHWANLDIATLDDMDLAYSWFRDARFIHIVRDGRDVALSHETMPYGSSNTLDCARSWRHRLITNLKMGAMLPSQSYKVLHYEDLVQHPRETLSNLCDFIGIAWSEDMLNYGEMVKSKIPEHRRWLWPDLDKKPLASKCYGWKTRMSDRKRVVFEGEAAGLLEELGYDTYDVQPKVLSAYLYELWCFLGTQGRFRRLGRKLGISQASTLEKQWAKKHGA